MIGYIKLQSSQCPTCGPVWALALRVASTEDKTAMTLTCVECNLQIPIEEIYVNQDGLTFRFIQPELAALTLGKHYPKDAER